MKGLLVVSCLAPMGGAVAAVLAAQRALSRQADLQALFLMAVAAVCAHLAFRVVGAVEDVA